MTPMPRQAPGAPWHARTAPVAALAAAGAGLALVRSLDPAESGPFLRCPLHSLTGIWCPGCGMTRATHAVLRGDLAAAIGLNAMFPVFAALLIGGWLTWFRTASGRQPPRWPSRAPAWSWLALGAVVVLFTVARNLQVAPFDALAP